MRSFNRRGSRYIQMAIWTRSVKFNSSRPRMYILMYSNDAQQVRRLVWCNLLVNYTRRGSLYTATPPQSVCRPIYIYIESPILRFLRGPSRRVNITRAQSLFKIKKSMPRLWIYGLSVYTNESSSINEMCGGGGSLKESNGLLSIGRRARTSRSWGESKGKRKRRVFTFFSACQSFVKKYIQLLLFFSERAARRERESDATFSEGCYYYSAIERERERIWGANI